MDGASPSSRKVVVIGAGAAFTEESSEELFPMNDEEITAKTVWEIRRVLPEMPDAVLFSRVYRWREAVCLSPGGTLSAMHRLRTDGIPGLDGFFLAGEYMDIPGVEGSLKSGVDAADKVARYIA